MTMPVPPRRPGAAPAVARPGVARPTPAARPAVNAEPVVEEQLEVTQEEVITNESELPNEEVIEGVETTVDSTLVAVEENTAAPEDNASAVAIGSTRNGQKFGTRPAFADSLTEVEYSDRLVGFALQLPAESLLHVLVSSYNTIEEQRQAVMDITRDLNDFLLTDVLQTNSVAMFNSATGAASPHFKRIAPGVEVVRNPSNKAFPANQVSGRITVELVRGGKPLRVAEGESLPLSAADADSVKASLAAQKEQEQADRRNAAVTAARSTKKA